MNVFWVILGGGVVLFGWFGRWHWKKKQKQRDASFRALRECASRRDFEFGPLPGQWSMVDVELAARVRFLRATGYLDHEFVTRPEETLDRLTAVAKAFRPEHEDARAL